MKIKITNVLKMLYQSLKTIRGKNKTIIISSPIAMFTECVLVYERRSSIVLSIKLLCSTTNYRIHELKTRETIVEKNRSLLYGLFPVVVFKSAFHKRLVKA